MTTATAIKQDVTACILCSRNCGLSVEIEDNQFKKIKGDDDHPFSQGYICQKAARLQHYQQHADRLTSPLKRQSDGSYQEISWDQAIQEIAEQLVQIRNTHGGTAFASVGGGGQGNHLGAAYGRQLLYAMKSFYAYNSLAQEKTGDLGEWTSVWQSSLSYHRRCGICRLCAVYRNQSFSGARYSKCQRHFKTYQKRSKPNHGGV